MMDIIGLVPAAGLATRLGKLPCSKEILPLYSKGNLNQPPKALSSHLLNAYKLAGIKKVYFILRKGKWDIPEYFGNGADLNMHFSYLIMQHPYGVPFTLNEAYPFVKNEVVAVGFPDILFTPKNAYCLLYNKLKTTQADMVLGLFPITNKKKWDLVDLNKDGTIIDISIKQNRTDLKFAWSIALWSPSFTHYMYHFVEKILIRNKGNRKVEHNQSATRELYPGDIMLSAIKDGLKASTVIFREGTCVDLGTCNDLNNYINS
jgi:glucose-1-phosphate thymidylyltransferase